MTPNISIPSPNLPLEQQTHQDTRAKSWIQPRLLPALTSHSIPHQGLAILLYKGPSSPSPCRFPHFCSQPPNSSPCLRPPHNTSHHPPVTHGALRSNPEPSSLPTFKSFPEPHIQPPNLHPQGCPGDSHEYISGPPCFSDHQTYPLGHLKGTWTLHAQSELRMFPLLPPSTVFPVSLPIQV